MRKYSPEERVMKFWSNVDKSNGEYNCWNWLAYKDPDGYGRFRWGKQVFKSNRLAYILRFGEIPNNLHVLHRCDNRACVNPEHLFLGNQIDNMQDMLAKGRRHSTQRENNPKAKLNEKQVEEIRQRYENGNILQRELAEEYGVTQVQISSIVRKKQWN